MALPLVANAEGGTLSATVATSDTGSGNAWDATVGTPLITYDNTHAYHSMAYKVTLSATTTAQQMSWTSTSVGTVGELWGRIYVWSNAAPATNRFGLIRFQVGGAQTARLIYETNGTLIFADAGNATEVQTTNTVTTGQWVRIEWHAIFTPVTGTTEIKLFNNADSATATETVTSATANLGTNCDRVDIGAYLNGSASTWTGWLDGIQVNATGFPGPIFGSPPNLPVRRRLPLLVR